MHPVHYTLGAGKDRVVTQGQAMAYHNPQTIYKHVFGLSIRWWLAEGAFLGMNTIPFVPKLRVQHLLATTVGNS